MGVVDVEEEEEEAPALGAAFDDDDGAVPAFAAAAAAARFLLDPERESGDGAAAGEAAVAFGDAVEVEVEVVEDAVAPTTPPIAGVPVLGVAPAELSALHPAERADMGPAVMEAGRPLSVETSRRGGGGRED